LILTATAVLVLALGGAPSRAQTSAADSPPLTLQRAFEQAWERQPEARALAQRRDAAQALRQAANAWTPEPATLEASIRSDRLHARQGAQELEFGVAVPLWLPRERQRTQDLAQAQARATESQVTLSQWQFAQVLRDAWWDLRRDQEELAAADSRWQASQRLAADVARRVKAGELSRADQHQADGAVATAQGEHALLRAKSLTSEQTLRALLGLALEAPLRLAEEAESEPSPDDTGSPHPLLQALQGKSLLARSTAALARVQSRGNPELTLLQTRDRAARGESGIGSVTLGLRFPLGSSDKHRAAIASAGAEQTEAEVAVEREQERQVAMVRSARAALGAARTVLATATERVRFASETRDFFDKSFRLGETDLPSRLRVELEAATAQREQARARIEVHHAIANLRQAMGLLPNQP
jgi:cobalt-zinc-cadmium efflux system outer membrane protein